MSDTDKSNTATNQSNKVASEPETNPDAIVLS